MAKPRNWCAAMIAGTAISVAYGAKPAHFSVKTDAANGCYAVGATAVVEVAVAERGFRPNGPVEAWVDDGWTNVVWRRTVDMSKEPTFKITLTRTTPGTLRIHLLGDGMREKLDRVVFGVDDIRPLTPFPDDFESYWKGERERLEREVPATVEKTPASDLSSPDRAVFRVSVATFGGGRIYGILAVPKGDGPFPTCVTVPGAGAGRIAPQHSRPGWISLTINIHGFPLGKTKAEQKKRFEAWCYALAKESGEPRYQRYGFAAGRDKPIYHNSILGMVRMLDWLAKESYAGLPRRTPARQHAHLQPNAGTPDACRKDGPVLRRLQLRAAHPHPDPHDPWPFGRQLQHGGRHGRVQRARIEGQKAHARPGPRPPMAEGHGIRALALRRPVNQKTGCMPEWIIGFNNAIT